jgi:hypothetical protein
VRREIVLKAIVFNICGEDAADDDDSNEGEIPLEDLGLEAFGLPSGFKTTKRVRTHKRRKNKKSGGNKGDHLERIAFDGKWSMDHEQTGGEKEPPLPLQLQLGAASFAVGEKCTCYWTGDGMMYPALITGMHLPAQMAESSFEGAAEPSYDLTFDFFLHKVEQVPQSWLCRIEEVNAPEGWFKNTQNLLPLDVSE